MYDRGLEILKLERMYSDLSTNIETYNIRGYLNKTQTRDLIKEVRGRLKEITKLSLIDGNGVNNLAAYFNLADGNKINLVIKPDIVNTLIYKYSDLTVDDYDYFNMVDTQQNNGTMDLDTPYNKQLASRVLYKTGDNVVYDSTTGFLYPDTQTLITLPHTGNFIYQLLKAKKDLSYLGGEEVIIDFMSKLVGYDIQTMYETETNIKIKDLITFNKSFINKDISNRLGGIVPELNTISYKDTEIKYYKYYPGYDKDIINLVVTLGQGITVVLGNFDGMLSMQLNVNSDFDDITINIEGLYSGGLISEQSLVALYERINEYEEEMLDTSLATLRYCMQDFTEEELRSKIEGNDVELLELINKSIFNGDEILSTMLSIDVAVAFNLLLIKEKILVS